MKSLSIAVSAAGLLLGASVTSAWATLAKPGAYTLLATVTSASSTACPFKAGTTGLTGYTAFTGFVTTAGVVSPTMGIKGDWVIAISPTSSTDQKYAYTLAKPNPATGQTLHFSGTTMYGNAADQFHANNGTYKLTVNPNTLASTLTVSGPKCVITYTITFTPGIPAKFLNLL